jgi:hypothetical protein
MNNLKNIENRKVLKGLVFVYELTFILFYYIIIILFLINHETLIVDSGLF